MCESEWVEMGGWVEETKVGWKERRETMYTVPGVISVEKAVCLGIWFAPFNAWMSLLKHTSTTCVHNNAQLHDRSCSTQQQKMDSSSNVVTSVQSSATGPVTVESCLLSRYSTPS